MKKYFLSLIGFLSIYSYTKAQSPQFAVVRPNGTTYICPSFDSAYTKAVDDDFIYLPGTVISGNKTISKRLTLIGTGHYHDSTAYTGKTVFAGVIYLEKKCTLEGFETPNHIAITNSDAANCSFIRLKIGQIFLGGTNDHFIDGSVVTYITGATLAENCTYSSSNILMKNSILQSISKISYSSIVNCIFLGHNSIVFYFSTANTSFKNCIFRGRFYVDWGFQPVCFPLNGYSSNNCIFYNAYGITIPGQNNYLDNYPDTIMVNSGTSGSFFDYSNNYHLKPNSPYLTAGDDGTEIGIYGGSAPYKEGAVPSNPHIYFKQVAPTTNSNGQLQIQFKVRTSN